MEWRFVLGVATAGVLGIGGNVRDGGTEERLFPFVMPWDDASEGVTNLSGWLHRPAGKFGPVRVGPDGHLRVGGERLRLSGVDLAFSGNFPLKEDARKIAPRLARFGINMVRFHIMDMFRFPEGIFDRDGKNTRDFDPEALDRLDYFTDQLERQGIYVYLCLLNYRPFNAADGLPPEIERLGGPFQGRHVVGFYDAAMLDLQKEYARKLLTHRNAYTGRTYAEDPAVAFVEINNENGLIHSWLGGKVAELPGVFLPELKRQWNEWLRARYGQTDRMRKVWEDGAEPPGAEMLTDGGFAEGVRRWILERHPGAEATVDAVGDAPRELPGARSARIAVSRPGTEAWHVRFQQAGLKAEAGRAFTLTFWARADRPGETVAGLEQAHAPWKNLGLRARVPLTEQWKPFRFVFIADRGDDDARLVFDPPMRAGEVRLAGVSLRPGGVSGLSKGERLEDGTVSLFPHASFGERTAGAQRDWLNFLWETEDRYWQAMARFVKDELKVRALVIGTIVGCSTPNLMARLDGVDTHAYWCHPVFPGRMWDAEDWIVSNRTMVNERGGTIPDLALRRVLGKPHCVTEYGHAAPNPHAGEGNLLRDAYAALQDWDYVSTSRYSHKAEWDLRRLRNFFDMDQHPTRLVALVPAAALFLRGDVKPARSIVVAALSREREVDVLRHGHAWDLVHAGHLGVPREAALIHRVALAVEGREPPPGALRPDEVKVEDDRFVSDTGELSWDLSEKGRGVLTVNTAKSKAVIGYGAGRRFELGRAVVEPGPTLQEGWSLITLTAMEGEGVGLPGRLLITATGYVENTKMGWKNPEKTTVGKDWGEAPSRVEGIPARILLTGPARGTAAWALDECGQRRVPVPLQADSGGGTAVVLGPRYRTLWYEVEVR